MNNAADEIEILLCLVFVFDRNFDDVTLLQVFDRHSNWEVRDSLSTWKIHLTENRWMSLNGVKFDHVNE